MSKKDTSKQSRTKKNNDDNWKPDKTQILTIEESLAKKEKEKKEK
jgi:hypothetical protein